MSFEVVGKLIKKYDTENKTGSFQAREFVIEIEARYPEYPKFQLVQDRCTIIDPYNEGDFIKVYFDLRGREWQGKYFTNLNAWRVEKAEAGAVTQASSSAAAAASQPVFNSPMPTSEDEPRTTPQADDDLPF